VTELDHIIAVHRAERRRVEAVVDLIICAVAVVVATVWKLV
jgi:hypothetical protein